MNKQTKISKTSKTYIFANRQQLIINNNMYERDMSRGKGQGVSIYYITYKR